MKMSEHPDDGLIIQYLDGELPENQFLRLRIHLASCGECRSRQDEFVQLSNRFEALVAASTGDGSSDSRINLAQTLVNPKNATATTESPVRVMRRFGWGMAIAAALAGGILLVPRPKIVDSGPVEKSPLAASSTSIYVNGENFIALPYSNPDLPVNAPRIVEMQIPASSLASAGLFLEPVANETSDHTVVANVLLGLDGQPIGVHVLSAE